MRKRSGNHGMGKEQRMRKETIGGNTGAKGGGKRKD